jgi:outer membrane protein assembly factor BamB
VITAETAPALSAPLALRWSVKHVDGLPLVAHDRVIGLDQEGGGLICIEDGKVGWRYPHNIGPHGAGRSLLGAEGSGPSQRLVELDLVTGTLLRKVECPWGIAFVFSDRRTFLGRRSASEAGGVEIRELALVDLDDLTLRWSVSSRGRDDEVFGSRLACDGRSAYVIKGDRLVAFDLNAGKERWATVIDELKQIDAIGRMGIRPMVAADQIVVGAPGLTVTCDAATGRTLWTDRRSHGARLVLDARVYCGGTWEFVVLDSHTGRVLLDVNLPQRIEKRWGFKGVDFRSGLAVSTSHFFMGDGEGRLYAFDRETGEPVWHHRPKGGNPYFGNVPVIANNRLYITTTHKPGRPGFLYCYEEAAS